jgi:lipooligosaccharide transport system permease protein
MVTLRAISRVWRRYLAIYRKNWRFGVVTTFVEPLLYLLSFGFGVGSLVGGIEVGGVTLTYRQFVFAGIVAQTVLFQAFFEAAYGGFVRMYYQKVFKAIAMTPITISEVLWGELLWDATKASFAALAVLTIGVIAGDFSVLGLVLSLPLILGGALMFAGLGLLSAAWAASIDEISYPQFLLVFPMFLFCGIFFPVDRLPAPLPTLVQFLPLTALVNLLRGTCLGLPVPSWVLLVALGWAVGLVALARRRMLARLIK